MPNPSHAANRPYVQRLRNAAKGRPLQIVHMSRFELVPFTLADQPLWNAGHLLSTTRPWSQVTGFFANDRTGVCATKSCRLSDSWTGLEGKDTGTRLRDYIDRWFGVNAYQRTVFYLARPDGTGVFYPTAAIASLVDPAYRAWRVWEAGEAMKVGGYDAVDLNHKLHQYQSPAFVGGVQAPNVGAIQDTMWTAAPTGYGYSEYVQGWHALSQDLRRAGIPYTVTIALRAWAGTSFDDKSTAVNEADLVREVMKGARTVLLDQPKSQINQAVVDQAIQGLAAYGARGILIDQTCGLKIENQLQPPTAPSVTR
jgi:hypothetical protein